MSILDDERLRLRMLDELRGALRPLEQVQAAADALNASLLARDLAALDALLADDSAMLICKRMLRDKRKILAALRTYLAEAHGPIHCECLQIEVKANGLVAFCSGSLLEGADRVEVGTFESVWRYDDDRRWRLTFAQASVAS
jgi:ketosteroid isomerase-like protein